MADTAVLKATIDNLIKEMEQVEVKNQEEYDFLSAWLKRNKESQKMVVDAFEADRLLAKKAYDDVLDEKKRYMGPLEASERIARQKLSVFATAQEQARRAEQKRLDDIARKEADDKRLAEAEKLAAAGKIEKADALLDKSVRPAFVPPAPKVGKMREVWTVEIIDLKALCLAVALGQADSIFVEANRYNLAASAQLLKDKFSIPGVKAEQTFVPVI